MEQRQKAIAELRDLHNKVSRAESLSATLTKTTEAICDVEEIIKQEEKVLRGSIKQKWKEVHYINNEKDAKLNFEKSNETKSQRRKNIFCVIGVLVNLAIFALSIMFLINEPETSWIKNSEYLYLFWIVHIVLGLGFSFGPIAFMHSSDK